MGFNHSNCIVVFNKNKDKLLFERGLKIPIRDYIILWVVSWKRGESRQNASYRELYEETGITKKNIAHIVETAKMYFLTDTNQNGLLKTEGLYVGVDGCKGGWIAATIK